MKLLDYRLRQRAYAHMIGGCTQQRSMLNVNKPQTCAILDATNMTINAGSQWSAHYNYTDWHHIFSVTGLKL